MTLKQAKIQLNQRVGKFSGRTIEQYVTGKTLDGLFLVIGEQEQQLRQNPAGAATDIVRRVFGAIR